MDRAWKDIYFQNMNEVLQFLSEKHFRGNEFKVVYRPNNILVSETYCVIYAVMIDVETGEVVRYGHTNC